MSTETKPPQYMLLFRGNEWQKGLSPEEMQKIAGQWMAWYERLTAQGKVKAGAPLERTGKTVSGKNGRVVSDGPFAESKEVVGGFAILKSNSKEEAIELARTFLQVVGEGECELRQIYEAGLADQNIAPCTDHVKVALNG